MVNQNIVLYYINRSKNIHKIPFLNLYKSQLIWPNEQDMFISTPNGPRQDIIYVYHCVIWYIKSRPWPWNGFSCVIHEGLDDWIRVKSGNGLCRCYWKRIMLIIANNSQLSGYPHLNLIFLWSFIQIFDQNEDRVPVGVCFIRGP